MGFGKPNVDTIRANVNSRKAIRPHRDADVVSNWWARLEGMPDRAKNEPVSLAPLTAEEALRALLAVDPDAEPAEPESRDDQAPGDDTDGQ